MKVPNQFPLSKGLVPYRIAIIGEAPGKDEVTEGKPFVGSSGRLLTSLLTDAGINRDYCYIGNICQTQPPNNKIAAFGWDSDQIIQGLEQLRADLDLFQPNLCILLGNTALRAAKGTYVDSKGKIKTYPISSWRGSLFVPDNVLSPFYNLKCLATIHPAALLRSFDDTPLVRWDLRRGRKHGTFKELPDENLVLDAQPHYDTIIQRLRFIRSSKVSIGVDIEGGVSQGVYCISISPADAQAFIIPFTNMEGGNYWSEDQEVEIWRELSLTLADTEVRKILQNAMYDRFVLAYTHKLIIRSPNDDIMLKHWELYCELAKNLGLQVSIYTEHPYHKGEIKTQDAKTFWTYCCKDSAITREIDTIITPQLKGKSLTHYNFNSSLQDPFLYVQLHGMKLDLKKRNDRIEELKTQAYFDKKNNLFLGTEHTKLRDMVGRDINVNSPDQMIEYLYTELKLPLQTEKDQWGVEQPTSNEIALLKLYRTTKLPQLKQVIEVRGIRKRTSGLEALTPDPDGRIRTSIIIPGTKTGRTSNSEAPTGNGSNLQTVPKEDRDIFLPTEEDSYFNQNDLAGADGWTVAAHCARLGDKTMLEDYLFGLKPAKILALMILHGPEMNYKSRAELKLLSKDINSETDPLNNYTYFFSKCGQHGTNYGMREGTLMDTVFKESDGQVDITRLQAKNIQSMYKLRYKGINLLHEWMTSQIKRYGYIECASGQRRQFFGRKDSDDTLRDALSTEPQANTTYATNLALSNLWKDYQNRDSKHNLWIKPIHQVHDALCTQFDNTKLDFAREKIRSYFTNPITIAGIELTIPFEGNYGSSWKDQPHPL